MKTLTEELQEKAREGLNWTEDDNNILMYTLYREDLNTLVADLVQTVLERVDGELYEVDVEKVPTIQEEAWANQYDSKSEAFWYGEAKAVANIKEAIIRLQQSDK